MEPATTHSGEAGPPRRRRGRRGGAGGGGKADLGTLLHLRPELRVALAVALAGDGAVDVASIRRALLGFEALAVHESGEAEAAAIAGMSRCGFRKRVARAAAVLRVACEAAGLADPHRAFGSGEDWGPDERGAD